MRGCGPAAETGGDEVPTMALRASAEGWGWSSSLVVWSPISGGRAAVRPRRLPTRSSPHLSLYYSYYF